MARACSAKHPGQSIVFFAVLLSTFLAMMALGTDVLIMYVERRAAQGVADLAALSAVPLSFTGSPSPAETQARATATANGYTNGVNGVVVQITNPTSSEIRVRITKDVSTIFAMTFGQSVTTVLGQATAIKNPPPPNMAIYSWSNNGTDTGNPYGVDMGGSGGTINGRVHSRCDLRVQNSNFIINASITYDGLNTDCNARIDNNSTTSGYGLNMATTWPIGSPLTDLSTYPCDYDRQGPVPNLPGSSPPRKPYANELSLLPGSGANAHTGQFDLHDTGGDNGTWWQNAPTNTILKTGVYCVNDGALKWTGTGSTGVSGTVTFILAGTSSQVDPFNPSNFTITAYAPVGSTNKMLIYSQGNGSHAVSLGGSGGSWNGFIYAPSPGAVISLAGNGTNSLTGALYGDNVNITGGGWTLTGTGPVPVGIFISGLSE